MRGRCGGGGGGSATTGATTTGWLDGDGRGAYAGAFLEGTFGVVSATDDDAIGDGVGVTGCVASCGSGTALGGDGIEGLGAWVATSRPVVIRTAAIARHAIAATSAVTNQPLTRDGRVASVDGPATTK